MIFSLSIKKPPVIEFKADKMILLHKSSHHSPLAHPWLSKPHNPNVINSDESLKIWLAPQGIAIQRY